MSFLAPGGLGREHPLALALEVTRVLDEVPPHLVPDQLVAEARRAADVAVALYVVDIDGSHLLRLAGSEEFPDQLNAPRAIRPEIVPEGLPEFYYRLQRRLPGCCAELLWLRGRVLGLLACVGTPLASLRDVAKLAGVLLPGYDVGGDWFDFVKNRDGARLPVADSTGKAPTAAGLGAAALARYAPRGEAAETSNRRCGPCTKLSNSSATRSFT